MTLEDVDTGMGFSFKMQNTCRKCGGKGIVFSEICDHCKGRRVVRENKKLLLVVEKGMKDGEKLVFHKESEQHPDITPGDLIVTLKQRPHRFFHTRSGNDLHANMDLNFKEALLGFSKRFKHLDGRDVEISAREPTQPFFVRKVVEEGMPHHKFSSQKGDLFLKMNVKLPIRLTEEEKELVKQLFN